MTNVEKTVLETTSHLKCRVQTQWMDQNSCQAVATLELKAVPESPEGGRIVHVGAFLPMGYGVGTRV